MLSMLPSTSQKPEDSVERKTWILIAEPPIAGWVKWPCKYLQSLDAWLDEHKEPTES
jgi:hypothetical protein